MSKYIITISRQFGSMGKTIAARMSEMLEIEFLDKGIVEETTRRMGFPVYMPKYVYASVQNRLNNCVELLGLSERESLRMIKEVDLAREKLHRQYNPNYESPFTGRDICIDSSSFGIDGTAEILSNIAKNKFVY